EPLAPATAQPGDLTCTPSKSMRDFEIVAEPRMSSKRGSTPAGDTIESCDTATSSRTTESQPGMKDGGLAGPVAGCRTTLACALCAPSAEMRPAKVSRWCA